MRNVLILEDVPIVRAALVKIIEAADEMRLCGQSARVQDAYVFLKTEPDFILADLMLEDGESFEFISVAKRQTQAKVLVLSVLGDEKSVLSAIRAGADGYIKKEATLQDIENAIGQLISGGAPMSPKIARHLLRNLNEPENENETKLETRVHLSKREIEVLEGLAQGLNYKEVARRHDLSHHTVAKYIKTVYRKLAVSSRAEAVLEGVRYGFINL